MAQADLRSSAAVRLTPADPDETSVLALWRSIANRRMLIGSLAAAGVLIGGVTGMLRPRTYTSHASFTTDDQRGNISSSLGQLGLSGLLGGGSQSAQLFLDLLSSRVILEPVLDSTYTVTEDHTSRRVTLAKLYAGNESNPIKARAKALDKLGSEAKAELRPGGAVSVDVTTTDRSLSQQIASRILARLNQFNLERRQARAATEREFSEGRVADAAGELHAAEARLQSFMQENRAIQNSPSLTVEQDRLQRAVAFRQTLYTAVAQAYEQARMEEARNTPTVSILEPASFPLHEAPRWGGAKSAALGLVIGTILGLMIAVFGDFFQRVRVANPQEIGEKQAEAARAKG